MTWTYTLMHARIASISPLHMITVPVHHWCDGTEGFFEALAWWWCYTHGSSEHKHDELDPTINEDHATVMLTSKVIGSLHWAWPYPLRVMLIPWWQVKIEAYYHKHDDELNKEFMKTSSGATNARGWWWVGDHFWWSDAPVFCVSKEPHY